MLLLRHDRVELSFKSGNFFALSCLYLCLKRFDGVFMLLKKLHLKANRSTKKRGKQRSEDDEDKKKKKKSPFTV